MPLPHLHGSIEPARVSGADATRRWLLHVALATMWDTPVDSADPPAWPLVAPEAEAQHLAALVDAAISVGRTQAPEDVITTLRAQALRHIAKHHARTAAIEAILDAFDRLSIDALLLKGAALAWMIYPTPSWRPMTDIDVLVPKAAADAALHALERLDFQVSRQSRRFRRNAHHLPVASRRLHGVSLNVDIHTDALSRDATSSMTVRSLSSPPRTLLFNGTPRRTLGHVDMLRHLAHHLLEPSSDGHVRLIGVVDLLTYANTFREQIDWDAGTGDVPFVINVLRCVHALVPLPETLRRHVPVSQMPSMAGPGQTIRPLRSILGHRQRGSAIVHELLNPPPWWMHAYYNIPPDASLTSTRAVRHPLTTLRWLYLRLSGV